MINGVYYVGSTTKLPEKRLEEHNKNKTKYTSGKGPWILKFYQEFDSFSEARKMENKIKKMKSRKIIEKIIADGFIKLK